MITDVDTLTAHMFVVEHTSFPLKTLTGDVANVRSQQCGVLTWDALEVVDECNVDLIYKIRLYSGISYFSTTSSERVVISSESTTLRLADHDNIPRTRPLRAMVSDSKICNST